MFLLLLKALAAASFLVIGAVLESADIQNATGITVVTTSETVAVVGLPCSIPGNTCKVGIKATLVFTPGTSTTSVNIRIYRGTSASGTLVSINQNQGGNFTAGSTTVFSMTATDALVNAGVAQYCVTITQVGAAGNGTLSSGTLETMVLSG
jgi:hypothetical protein